MKSRSMLGLLAPVVFVIGCSQSDPGVTTSVKSQLMADELVKARNINVDTRDHVVTLTGTVQSAAEEAKALQIARSTKGVTDVVDKDKMEAHAMELAHKLAKGPTQAYGAIKNARNQGLGLDPVKGFEAQILANVELMFHKDAREGPRAFKEGREPNYTAEWIDLQYDPLRPYE